MKPRRCPRRRSRRSWTDWRTCDSCAPPTPAEPEAPTLPFPGSGHAAAVRMTARNGLITRTSSTSTRASASSRSSRQAPLPPPAPSSLATGGGHSDPLKASEEDLLVDGEHGLDDFVNWHRPPSQRLVSTYKSPEP
jgi:hypothetical protein